MNIEVEKEDDMLIEVGGYNGKSLWIESSKVVGMSAKPPAMCVVNMACGEQTEEWQLCDNFNRVRRAVDEANIRRTCDAPKETR